MTFLLLLTVWYQDTTVDHMVEDDRWLEDSEIEMCSPEQSTGVEQTLLNYTVLICKQVTFLTGLHVQISMQGYNTEFYSSLKDPGIIICSH